MPITGFSGLLRNTSGLALNALTAALFASGVFIEAAIDAYSLLSSRSASLGCSGFSALVLTERMKNEKPQECEFGPAAGPQMHRLPNRGPDAMSDRLSNYD